MPIKCLFGDYTSHENEKKMLDKFLSQLVPVYGGEHDPWIYVVYNAMWSGQEVDLVCITNNSIVVTDLKNYSGSVQGQENGEWVMNSLNGEEIVVKGGGQINPFVQVRKNRYAVMEWLKSENMLLRDNIGHIAGLILFTEIKESQIKLSHGVSNWFYVSDIPHIDQYLPTYGSKEINIAVSEAEEIVKALRLQEYQWTPSSPLLPKYSPFSTTAEASRPLATAVEIKHTANLPVPAINPPSKLKAIYLPMLALFVVAGGVGYGFVDQVQKKGSFVSKAVDSVTPSFVSDIFAMTGLSLMGELRNSPEDLSLYGEHPETITHFDSSGNEALWTTFQLLDLEKGTVYGMKIGETKFKDVEPLKLINDTAFLRDDQKVVPGQVRNIHQLVNKVTFKLPEEVLKEMETYHPKFPRFDIAYLKYISTWFSPEGVVRGVSFEVDEHGAKQAILPYLRRYKSLGYKVQEGSLAGHVGYSYAVLTKGDEVVVLNDPHMSPLSITHTTKAVFESNRDTLVREKGSSSIPLGEIRKL